MLQSSYRITISMDGGGAMLVNKYGAKEACPVTLRCTGRAFGEEGVEKSDEPEIESNSRSSAVQLHCKSSAA
ncbi:MAG: hypothetical protein RIS97_1436 [Pseudomonadota bacterium]